MRKYSITDIGHQLIKPLLSKNNIIVDATCGNGYDTLFLCENVGFVYAFDIQVNAINNTEKLLQGQGIVNFKVINDSHENITNHIAKFDGVIFNLGYLPGSDKQIKTTHVTTVRTVEKLMNHPNLNFILITSYPGHPEGEMETSSLLDLFKKPNNKVNVHHLKLINNIKLPPEIFLITFNR